MRVAVPTANGMLCPHFGHCDHFAFVEADPEAKTVGEVTFHPPPPHEPGVLPRWLHEQGVDVVLAGGMGMRAQALFQQAGVRVVVGAPAGPPADIVQAWLEGTLETGENLCAH